ncbi:MAG: VapC toxin family PIN domain ribonuclease [Burkholderiales bacterium]|nr:VapC toxin family PIN domain ribonuclease [Burkholderiales bacterium]
MPAAASRIAAREPSARYLSHAGPVLVDSGPLIALFNAADRWHAPVLGWLQANPSASLVSTWCVATEVCALLARRLHNEAALDFLRWAQRGALTLDRAVDGSLTEVLRISERFAGLPFDLTDASIAEAAARLKLRHVLSIDADFDVYRDRAGRPLVNLLRR